MHFNPTETSVPREEEEYEKQIEALIDRATEEVFEDGEDNAVYRDLSAFVACNSVTGVQTLAVRLVSSFTNAGAAADIVRSLARIQHAESHNDRLWIAERLLTSDSPLTRDASGIAIAELNDPHAIPALQAAIDAESIPELRKDLEAVLRDLEDDANGISPDVTKNSGGVDSLKLKKAFRCG